ncbi:unnamed protein product [Rhizophagus irregularis]|nr:unnamed protein product [Rhizophagus irregularis]
MSHNKFRIYRFQPYESQESSATTHIQTTNSQYTNNSHSILNTTSASSSHLSQTNTQKSKLNCSYILSLETFSTLAGEGSTRTVCVCDSCKNNRKRYPCPQLYPILDVIEAIPIAQRRFLSPIFLHCSLGRNLDANSYTEYHALTGDMEFSKNIRALKLYSGILGAFLTNPGNHNHSENLSWLTPQLLLSASSLITETSYLDPFPTASHIPSDTNASPFQEGNIVLSSTDFSTEIHNEDFHYTYLMAGFIKTSNTTLPLAFDNPDLEPLIFPDLFPDGQEHFYSQNANTLEDNTIKTKTYGKYIKYRLLYTIYRPPTASELITRSIYTGKRIINESKTTTLPSFIQTGDTYFNEKLLHINAMIRKFRLPSLFIILTAAESKWIHLKDILKSTDNGNEIPTNRSLHTSLYFTHRKRELWNYVWRKPANSNWGNLIHFFERIGFQNRGAPHTHTILWVEKTIDKMINENIVRSTLPNPKLEPELYQLVVNHQIHTCNPRKCGGSVPPGQTCKKNFPHPYSLITYYNASVPQTIQSNRIDSDLIRVWFDSIR